MCLLINKIKYFLFDKIQKVTIKTIEITIISLEKCLTIIKKSNL